ncbi:MAG: DUF3341 domain-containing protein [Deltaproteobacteria bacterium]
MSRPMLGLFDYVDDLLEAAQEMKNAGYCITVFSPIPLGHEIEHAIGEKKNPLKWLTLLGAVGGFFTGLVFTLGTSAMYPLSRGGKPIFAITPTLLIAYETTILFGVLFTIGGFFLFSRLPFFGKRPNDEAFNIDSFGLMVEGVASDSEAEIGHRLVEFGAKEVKTLE